MQRVAVHQHRRHLVPPHLGGRQAQSVWSTTLGGVGSAKLGGVGALVDGLPPGTAQGQRRAAQGGTRSSKKQAQQQEAGAAAGAASLRRTWCTKSEKRACRRSRTGRGGWRHISAVWRCMAEEDAVRVLCLRRCPALWGPISSSRALPAASSLPERNREASRAAPALLSSRRRTSTTFPTGAATSRGPQKRISRSRKTALKASLKGSFTLSRCPSRPTQPRNGPGRGCGGGGRFWGTGGPLLPLVLVLVLLLLGPGPGLPLSSPPPSGAAPPSLAVLLGLVALEGPLPLPPPPSAEQVAARCGLLPALRLNPSAGWLHRLLRACARGCHAWDATGAHPPVQDSALAPGMPALSIVGQVPGQERRCDQSTDSTNWGADSSDPCCSWRGSHKAISAVRATKEVEQAQEGP